MADKKVIIGSVVLGVLILLAFIPVLAPEIGFDALWYHLTLPKLLIETGQYYFPGGLLYYSVMPRLSEMLFVPLMSLLGTSGPKLLQFAAGLGTAYLIYNISSILKVEKKFAIFGVVIFYGTWLVGWQSSSAYIDLIRTFFEVLALYYAISNKKIFAGIFLGLAVGTKWLGLISVFIYSLVFSPLIGIVALVVASPWFIISYHHTANPVYPLFEPFLHNSLLPLQDIISRLVLLPVSIAVPYDDFLSPYIPIAIILAVFSLFSKNKNVFRISAVGVLGAMLSQTLNPPSSRYFLPYLPSVAISSIYLVSKLKPKISQIICVYIVLSSLAVIVLRAVAVHKFIPYILGRETKNQFLYRLSLKLPDTFIDTDGYVETKLDPNAKYLLDGLHNLYYFPYKFDHSSWVIDPKQYDYLVTGKNSTIDTKSALLLHENDIGIKIYQINHD